ncbi:bifunctional adenosylcobinamide kinase/adenosylcobinamide-phosphate guanylyltransferase [Fredinandcohnia humi]
MIIFISGGARSGKSQFAEETALSLFHKAKGKNHRATLYYIATAKNSDDEMEERIRIHRKNRGIEWQTVEESFDILPILINCRQEDVILIDCLTIWVSNVLFELGYSQERIEDAVSSWLRFAQEKQIHLLIVSNDVNEEIPFSDKAVLTYLYSLQRLHQKIVNQSELVVQLQAGIPTFWKGELV